MIKHWLYSAIAVVLILPAGLLSQSFSAQQKVFDNITNVWARFGHDVEIRDPYAFVGSPQNVYDSTGGNPIGNAGIVVVYKRNNFGQWQLHQRLQSPNRNNLAQFGWSLAVEDSLLVVGARGEWVGFPAGGAAHVFKLDNNGYWQHQHRLIPNDTSNQNRFGESVAISWPYIAVGAEHNDLDSAGNNFVLNAGAAYVFEYNGGQWVQGDKFTAPSGRSGNALFGKSVAVDSNRVLVGAPEAAYPSFGPGSYGLGVVFEYTRQASGQWNLTEVVVDSAAGGAAGKFGMCIELDGDLMIIGAEAKSIDTNISNGQVVLMKESASGWKVQQYVYANRPAQFGAFGRTIDFDGTNLVVGSIGDFLDQNNQNPIAASGAAYWYSLNPTRDSLIFEQKIVASDRGLPQSQLDAFASSVAVDNGYFLAGATGDRDTGTGQSVSGAGTAYFFDTICTVKNALFNDTICSGDSLLFNNQYLSLTGTYQAVFSAKDGCDSIVFLNLLVSNLGSDSISVTTCDSYTLPSGSGILTTSGNYLDTLLSATGCDSLLYIDLTINQSITTSITDSGCGSYTLPGSMSLITASGQYFDTLQTANGCDSILDLNLTIVNVDTAILVDQGNQQIIALGANATFRWLDCENNYAVIPGIVNDTAGFQPGTYAVEITQNGCVDTSRCVVLRPSHLLSLADLKYLEIYPNPVQGHFMIKHHPSLNLTLLNVYSSDGRLLRSFDYPNPGDKYELKLPPGQYLVVGYTSDGEIISHSIQLASP